MKAYELTDAELENGPLVDALRATGCDISLRSWIDHGHCWSLTTDELLRVIHKSHPGVTAAHENLVAAGYNAELVHHGLKVWGDGWEVTYAYSSDENNVYHGKVPPAVEEIASW